MTDYLACLDSSKVEQIIREASAEITAQPRVDESLMLLIYTAPPSVSHLFEWSALFGAGFSTFASITDRTTNSDGSPTSIWHWEKDFRSGIPRNSLVSKKMFQVLKRVNEITDSCDVLPVISLLITGSLFFGDCKDPKIQACAYASHETAIALVSATILHPATRYRWVQDAIKKANQLCKLEASL